MARRGIWRYQDRQRDTLLDSADSYSGGTTIDAGTITLGNSTALGPAASASVTFGAGSAGELQLNGNSVTLVGLNSNATMPGAPIVENGAAGAATLTLNTAAGSTYTGVLQQGGGPLALAKTGSGDLTLSGTNTYTGGTTLKTVR